MTIYSFDLVCSIMSSNLFIRFLMGTVAQAACGSH